MKADRHPDGWAGLRVGERIRNALVVVAGAALMIGLSVATMMIVAAPDGWVMKTANQAMLDQQQVIATKFAINSAR